MNRIKDMENAGIEIKSEFLALASRLVYIKTVSMLPRSEEEKELKTELKERLIRKERLKTMAAAIADRLDFESFVREPSRLSPDPAYKGKINPAGLLKAYRGVFGGTKGKKKEKKREICPITTRKVTSVYSKIIHVLRKLKKLGSCPYERFFPYGEGKSSLIATFLAILELVKKKRALVIRNDEKISLFFKGRDEKKHGRR